eukprot:NODE_24_length_41419_cov_0.818780.p27 type:complete len:162 gc:universal NODE_24_length_41419_cov_0.818780:10737-10252(-)
MAVSSPDLEEYTTNAKKLGMKYGAIGLGLGVISSLAISRYSPTWKNVALGPKTFVVLSPGMAGFVIGSEQATYVTRGSSHFQEKPTHLKQDKSWRQSFNENKYKIVGSVWGSTMLATLVYLSSQKNMKISEKLIHGRIIAQSATVGALVGTALVTGMSSHE